MHQNSPFSDQKSKKNLGRGSPHPPTVEECILGGILCDLKEGTKIKDSRERTTVHLTVYRFPGC